MKAVVINDFGGLEQVHLEEMAPPTPAKGEVKIEVHYVSVNPVEWKICAGVLKDILPHQFPIVLGWDVSGVVVEVGEGVSHLQIGDEVYGYCRGSTVHAGTFAEYCCFDAQHVVPKPKNLSHAQAAAIPLVGLTAWQALFDVAKLKKGQTCLIHAGAGGVGSVAIPLAKWAGATVATTASSKNHDYVSGLGADHAIDYNTANFGDEIKSRYPEGVDFVFDCVGGQTLDDSYACVKKGGWIVSIVEHIDRARAKELGINATNVFVRADGPELFKLKELIEAGSVPCPAIHEMPLDIVVEALEKVKTEHTRGKIVLKVR